MLVIRLWFFAAYAVATDVYVVPADLGETVSSGPGLGSPAAPYNSIVQAFKSMTAGGSYTVYLGFSGSKQIMVFSTSSGAISATSDVLTPPPPGETVSSDEQPANNWKQATSVVVKPWWCSHNASRPALCDNTNSKRQTVSWINYEVRISVMKDSSLQWVNIDFTGEKLLDTSCTQEYCRHCFMESLLYVPQTPSPPTFKYSGTGYAFPANDPIIDNSLNYNKVCSAKFEESQLYFFSLETALGTLAFKSVSFKEFRIRLPSVINVFMGTLKLTNVDFTNMEPGIKNNVDSSDFVLTLLLPAAIITATVPKTPTPESINQEKYCTYGMPGPIEQQFKPCSTIIWDTGTVTGLNRDYNYAKDSSLDNIWGGVISAIMVDSITITNVNFHDNFAPTADIAESSDEIPGALINIAYAGEVSITSCTFTHNMAKMGMIYIQMIRTYLKDFNDDNVVFTDLTFEYTFSSFFASAITVKMKDNVNLLLENCTFKYGHGTNSAGTIAISSNSLSADDLTGFISPQYKHPITNINYTINPLKVTITGLTFDTNYSGKEQASALTLQKLATVTVTSCTFTRMKGHGDDTLSAYSMWEYLKLNSLIRPAAMPIDNGVIVPEGTVSITKVLSLTMTSCTFTDNTAGIASVLTANSYISMSIVGNTFTSNTLQSDGHGIALEVSMCPIVPGTYIDITECTFTSNMMEDGFQGIGVVTTDRDMNCEVQGFKLTDVQRVRLTSPKFTNNIGGISVEASELVVTNGEFTSNKSADSSAIDFESSINSNASVGANKLTISSCTFTTNVCTGQGAADISIANGSGSQLLTITISDSMFTGSIGAKAASIMMDGNPQLGQSDSKITNCKFSGTSTSSGGGVITTSFLGVFTISATTFSNVKSTTNENASCILAQHQPNSNREDSTKSATYLQLSTVVINGSTKASAAIIISSIKAEVRTVSCTFLNIENAVVYNAAGYYVDTGSTFTGTSGTNHIFYSGAVIGKAWLTSTSISNAYYNGDGAGVNIINSSAAITITGATFNSNTSDSKGGAIYVANNAVATISNCVFTNNKAKTGSAIYILTSLSAVSTVSGSIFANNVGQGVIYLLEGKVKVTTSTFDSNTSTSSPGIYSLLSTVITSSCVFKNHVCTQGCFVLAIAASTYTDTGSSFSNGKSTILGSVILAQATTVSLTDSSISSSTTTKEGALHILDVSTLSLTRVTFSNCLTNYGIIGGASVIHIEQSNLMISTATIDTFNNMGIFASSSDIISIDGLSIQNGNSSAITGGGLYCSDCTQVSILNSAFQNIVSSEGGCLMFEGVNFSNYTIANSRFQNCNSTMGGAIYATDKGLTISNSNFSFNHALKSPSETTARMYETGRGGAVYLLCSDKLKCRSTITNSIFRNNSAYSNGGAICWEDYEPVFTNVNFSGNSATYGNNIASFAIAILPWVNASSQRALAGVLNDVASGQVGGSPPIYMALYDKYEQVVTTDVVSTASLNSGNANTSMSGTIKVTVDRGTFTFKEYGITAKPGSETQIFVTSDGIDIQQTEKQEATKADIFVSVRNCTIGEILTSANACLVCDPNTYTLLASAAYCTPCPSYATCLKGALIYPQAGYWRSKNTTDTFFSCPRAASCLGNENYTSPTGVCATGYTGHLCNSCESGYSRTSKNTCQACPDPSVNGLRIGGIAVAVIILIVFLVKSTMSSALRPKELTSVYLRILMNYLQLVMLTSTFNLNWPSLVKSLLSTQESAGTATAQIFSFDCYMADISSVNVLYQKLIMFFMMPGFIVIISFVFWLCVAARRFDFSVLRNQMVATIIILLFLAHPNIVQTIFGMLSCTTIDPGEQWLVDDPSIRCWKGDHLFYTLTIALPGVAAWCMGIPTAALLLIVKNHRELNFIGIKCKYGFLYNGYKQERYYWEFVIIYRKILIIFISVFVSSISVDVQALSVMLVILVAFHLQHAYRPYAADELNDLELLSIFTSGVTIYSGLYFLTNDLNDATGIAFFFIIVIANGCFLTYWFFGMNNAYLEKFAKLKPRIMAKLCRCIPSVLQVANRQIKNMDLQNFDVVEMTYQKVDRTKKKEVFGKKEDGIIETAVDKEESLGTISEDNWMESDHSLYIEICRNVTITQRVRNSEKASDTLRPDPDKLEDSTIIDLES